LDIGGEISVDVAKNGKRDVGDAVLGFDGLCLSALRVEIGDGDPGAVVANLLDDGLIADDLAELLRECLGDMVHPADGLKHGGLPIDGVL
jgi:hypothetical protein